MRTCPYCGRTGKFSFCFLLRIYNQCSKCDLIYQNRRENYQSVLAPYHGNYFGNYSIDQKEGTRNKLYSHILDLIDKRVNPGKILDVGTGCGFFLLAAQKTGWQVRGIEPSQESVEIAKMQNGLNVFKGTLREYRGSDKFDVITLINVLDHSAEPWREIERSRQLLKSGGLIFIRFPNGFLHSILYRLASKFKLEKQAKKFLVFHQFSFTQKFIQRLMSDKGFSEIKIINSIPTEGDPHNIFLYPIFAEFIKIVTYLFVRCVEKISFKKIFLGTSLEVMATKK